MPERHLQLGDKAAAPSTTTHIVQQTRPFLERSVFARAQVVTPVRRSQRGSAAAPPSTGALLRGAGFMYAPNQALAPRLTPAAGRAAGALGDVALAGDLRGSLSPYAVRPCGALPRDFFRAGVPLYACLSAPQAGL